MNTYFALFGDKHPTIDQSRYVEISADNFGIAMVVMKRKFRGNWSIMLDAGEFEVYKKKHPDVVKYGLTLCE